MLPIFALHVSVEESHFSAYQMRDGSGPFIRWFASKVRLLQDMVLE